MSTFTKPTGIQKRSLRGAQLRADSQGDEMTLVGYAASFNTLSQDLGGGFKEVIAPGAFKRSLDSGADVKALFNHDPNQILGRRGVNLTVEEDSYGLRFRCALDRNSATAREVYQNVKSGLINECSFAFTIPEGGDEWCDAVDERGKPYVKRTLRNVNLLDVSAVTYPAYAQGTSVGARSADYTAPVADETWRTQALARLNAAMLPVQKQPPTTEELRARAARFAVQIQTRDAADVDELEGDDFQDLVTARFGMARNGLVPRYIVTETHSNNVVACDMDEDEMSSCCIPYSRDNDDKVAFGEPEVSSVGYPTRSLTLMEAKDKVAMATRMAAKAGRTLTR